MANNWHSQHDAALSIIVNQGYRRSTRSVDRQATTTARADHDCASHDTAIGRGLVTDAVNNLRGAGYECVSSPCSAGNVNSGGNGLLWGG